ncbi:hypothetical protein YPF_4428 [Yersinia pestis biovar Orientalis str. India 195]|nr:hypothetical protein YPF_4428 [Yersinia pestis biovar Orientalis str. India 195]
MSAAQAINANTTGIDALRRGMAGLAMRIKNGNFMR